MKFFLGLCLALLTSGCFEEKKTNNNSAAQDLTNGLNFTNGGWVAPTPTPNPSPTPNTNQIIPPISSPTLPVLWGRAYVIAPSISTRQEANIILRENLWIEEFSPLQADGVLVVVRSGLFSPLSPLYTDINSLETEANMQLNISGSKMHTYLYEFGMGGSLNQVYKTYYEVGF